MKKKQWGFSSWWNAFWWSSLYRDFIFELFVLWIGVPIPYSEQFFNIYFFELFGDTLGFLMFFRSMHTLECVNNPLVFFIVRVIRDFSSVYQKRAMIIQSNPKLTNNQFGFAMTFRVILQDHLVLTLAVLSAVATLIGAFGMYIFERKVPGSPLQNFGNVLYLSMASMTSIGFGEYYPKTWQGKGNCL